MTMICYIWNWSYTKFSHHIINRERFPSFKHNSTTHTSTCPIFLFLFSLRNKMKTNKLSVVCKLPPSNKIHRELFRTKDFHWASNIFLLDLEGKSFIVFFLSFIIHSDLLKTHILSIQRCFPSFSTLSNSFIKYIQCLQPNDFYGFREVVFYPSSIQYVMNT